MLATWEGGKDISTVFSLKYPTEIDIKQLGTQLLIIAATSLTKGKLCKMWEHLIIII